MTVPLPTPARITLPSGDAYLVRPAEPADAPHVTRLIHAAFEPWKRLGLSLSPMRQTEEDTLRHLQGKGMVAVAGDGVLAGTFSLEHGRLEPEAGGSLLFHEGGEIVRYQPLAPGIPAGRRLVFKKAAVAPDRSRSGLGTLFYDLAEGTALGAGYEGMALETVEEAVWLYGWYLRLGFTPIARCRYPGSAHDTLLLVKDLCPP